MQLAYLEREGVEEVGWRIATYADYVALFNYLGGIAIAAAVLKAAGETYWESPNNGIDYYGFEAQPAGLRNYDGVFANLTQRTDFWTSTTYDALKAMSVYLNNNANGFALAAEKAMGKSVRLVRDLTTPPIDHSQITDGEFRITVRNHKLCWDKALTGLAFNGVEDQDWENFKMIP